MASIAGLRGSRAIRLYGLSKAALAPLVRDLAVEWGPTGVRVNAISPGLIRTPLATGLLADAAFMQRRRTGRSGRNRGHARQRCRRLRDRAEPYGRRRLADGT